MNRTALVLALALSLTVVGIVASRYGASAQTYNPGGALLPGKGGDLASAATITPTNIFHDVTGTTTINTVTAPAGIQAGQRITLRAKGLWLLGTSGNVQVGVTAVIDSLLDLLWDGTKWNPSYVVAGAKGGTKGGQPAATTVPAGTLYVPTNDYVWSRSDGTNWEAYGLKTQFVLPVNADFAWVNQGTASVSTNESGIFLRAPAPSPISEQYRIRKKAAPATPWTLQLTFLPHIHEYNGTARVGIVLRESSTSKITTFSIDNEAGVHKWSIANFNDEFGAGGAFVRRPASYQFWDGVLPMFEVSDDGTNLKFALYADYFNRIQVHSVSRTSHMAGGPNEIGFFVSNGGQGFGLDMGGTFFHWKVT